MSAIIALSGQRCVLYIAPITLMIGVKCMKYWCVLALVTIGGPAFAQEAAPAPCPTTPAPLPAELAGWASASPVTAAATGAEIGKAQVPVGSRADIALLPAAQVQFLAPEKAPKADTSSGMVHFTVPMARTYRVALGAGAWIDVVRDGKPMASGAHGHGVPCTPVRKTVDFALTPGDYVLQISGNRDATLSVLILPLLP
ncbi:MAG: homogentisate 1,2-dioxygenase [Sphingomonas sp.]